MPELFPGMDVSRETETLLKDYAAQIRAWSAGINLIARSTLDDIWQRHILDSAQIMNHAEASTGLWMDLGSGGGLPGIVLAILAKDHKKELRFELVESDSRKAAFLKLMIAKYALAATVIQERVESLPPSNAIAISARALAPLNLLLALAQRHIAPDGFAYFLKGRTVGAEIEQARQNWDFTFSVAQSIVDPEGRLLLISDIRARKGNA